MYVCAPDIAHADKKSFMEAKCCSESKGQNEETIIKQNACSDAVATIHNIQRPVTGKFISCLATPNLALNSTDTYRKEIRTRFHKLNWPPKCKCYTLM